ncbi:MAG: hypothetical protein QXJ14_01835 [Candidatus Aenigmatarchaeota archaeon]
MVRAKKGKIWVDILAPPLFQEKILTKSVGSEEKSFIGKTLEFPLYLLDESKKDKFYYIIKARISEIENGKAKTSLEGIRVLKNYLEKFVKSGEAVIHHVKDISLSNGKTVRVKTFATLDGKPKNKTKTLIRKEIEKYIEKKFKNASIDLIVKSVIEDEIKKELTKEINKFYPVKVFEVKEVSII